MDENLINFLALSIIGGAVGAYFVSSLVMYKISNLRSQIKKINLEVEALKMRVIAIETQFYTEKQYQDRPR